MIKSPFVIASAIFAIAAVLITLIVTGHFDEIWKVASPLATAGVGYLAFRLLKKQAATDEKVAVVAESTARRDEERKVEKAILHETLNEMKTTMVEVKVTTDVARDLVAAATNVNIKAMPDDAPGPKDNG